MIPAAIPQARTYHPTCYRFDQHEPHLIPRGRPHWDDPFPWCRGQDANAQPVWDDRTFRTKRLAYFTREFAVYQADFADRLAEVIYDKEVACGVFGVADMQAADK